MADGDPSLRVPTQTVRVEVAFLAVRPHTVELFAPVGDVPRPARARVAELLERDQAFLPARDTLSGGLETLGARSITWIAVALAPTDELLGDDELFEHRRDVRVDLADGTSLSGELLYSAPAPRSRIVDVLNGPGRFIPVWLPERVVFVNKAFVRRLVEVPHEHRPTVVAPPPAERAPSRKSSTKAATRTKGRGKAKAKRG